MRTKKLLFGLLMLVLCTANVYADKYYQHVGHHYSPVRYTKLSDILANGGNKFMIYNTTHKLLTELNRSYNYAPKNVSGNKTREDRAINYVQLKGGKVNKYELNSDEKKKVYVDKTDAIPAFVVKAGETVTPVVERNGGWMNAAVFIDHNADGFVTKTVQKIKPSKTLPTEGMPEHIYYMKNGESTPDYATPEMYATKNKYKRGQFAFYAVEGVENAYYIYNISARKWVSYTKASAYNNGKGFVTLSNAKGEYFYFNNYSDKNYQINPYRTDNQKAGRYLNWYEGGNANAGTTIGLYNQDGNADAGSRWQFEYIDYNDVAAFSFYSFNDAYDTNGYNDAGTELSGPARNRIEMSSFTAPTIPGFYRMRFMLDWNSLNPEGTGTDKDFGGGNTMSNGGAIVDVILEVEGDTDYTGFLYNNNNAGLGITKYKYKDKMIYNECHTFELEKANDGDDNSYYLKSVLTGSYIGFDGKSYSTPQTLYIYSWHEATTLDKDTIGENGVVLTNGTIKQDMEVNSEAANYSVIQNSQLRSFAVADSADINGDLKYHQVFIISDKSKNSTDKSMTKYWAGEANSFALGNTGYPFAFYQVDDVDAGDDYPDIEMLHIYSRCDLFSAQKIYGYVQSGSSITKSPNGICDRLIDGDYTTCDTTFAANADPYFTIDLGDDYASIDSFYLYMARNSDAEFVPTAVTVSGSADGASFTTLANIETGLEYNSQYYSTDVIVKNPAYKYIRISSTATNESFNMAMSLSELYIFPATSASEQALTYNQLPIVGTRDSYRRGVDSLEISHPEIKLLSGVPLAGNKYYIYADAYDPNEGMYVGYDLKVVDTDGTYSLSPDGDYITDSKDPEKKEYYAWICEQRPNGKLVFRNAVTGQYLANGTVQGTAYEWDYITNETCRFGVPLFNSSRQYLTVATLPDGTREWVTTNNAPQNQTVEVDGNLLCTDFLFIPIECSANEKKVTIFADPLGIRNSIFRVNGVEYKLPYSCIMTKVEIPSEITALGEENYYIATMKNKNGYHVTSTTDDTSSETEAGRFIFSKHPEVADAWYIYSLDKKKWVTYEVSTTYTAAHNFVTLSNAKVDNAYFYITSATTTPEYSLIQPNTGNGPASIYINWYRGVGSNTSFGLWTDGDKDAGSNWAMTELSSDDLMDKLTIEPTSQNKQEWSKGDIKVTFFYHRFLGFTKRNTDGSFEDPVVGDDEITSATLTFDDIQNNDIYKADFRITPQPIKEKMDGTDDRQYYTITNAANGNQLRFNGNVASMTLTPQDFAANLFYFTGVEFDENSHAKAFIGNAITTNKMYYAGDLNDDGTTKSLPSFNVGGQPYYIQPNSYNGKIGYAITQTKLDETNNPKGLCANLTTNNVGEANVENDGAVWAIYPVGKTIVNRLLRQYIAGYEQAGETHKGIIQHIQERLDALDAIREQQQTNPDATKIYPVYDEVRIQEHRARLIAIRDSLVVIENGNYVTGDDGLSIDAPSGKDFSLLKLNQLADELNYMYKYLESTTLKLPETTEKWGDDLSRYNPHWYYIRNVEASWDKTHSYAAKYVADNENMRFTDVLVDENKSLANLFYIGGEETKRGATYTYLANSCIHNFSAHYHKDGQVIDKTLVSENKPLFDDVSVKGTGKVQTNIPGVKPLDNTVGWRVVIEGASNGNSFNNWGSSFIATGSDPTGGDYTNGFQVYLQADGDLVIKVSAYNDLVLSEMRGAYENFTVELFWTPKTFEAADAVEGSLFVRVTNSLGNVIQHTLENRTMGKITNFSSALPIGVEITNFSAEEVVAMTWNEEHDASSWFVLPSSNTTYPGHSIVRTAPDDSYFGWTNVNGVEDNIHLGVGSHDFSTWEFVKVENFQKHMKELLDLWNIDNCVIYHRPLVLLYEELKSLYDSGKTDEATFNKMIVAIRRYNSLPKEDFYAPKEGKLYTIRPAYEKGYENAAMVDADNEMVKKQSYAFDNDGIAAPVIGKTYYMYAKTTNGKYFLYDNGTGLAATNDITGIASSALCWTLIDEGAGKFALKNGNGKYMGENAKHHLALGTVTDGAVFKMDNGSLFNCASYDGGKYMVINTTGTAFNRNSIAVSDNSWCSYYMFVEAEYDSKAVWSFENVDDNGTVTADVKSIHTLSYMNDLTTSPIELNPDGGQAVTLSPIGSSVATINIGGSYLTRDTNGAGTYLSAGADQTVADVNGNVADVYNPTTSWYIEEVSDYERIYHAITVPAHGHATLMLGFDATIPNGIAAFWPRQHGPIQNDFYMSMQSYDDGIIPANAPVLLRMDNVTSSSPYEDFVGNIEPTGFKFYYSKVAIDDVDSKMPDVLFGALYNTMVDCEAVRGNYEEYRKVYMLQMSQDTPRLYWIWENANADGDKVDENGNVVDHNVKTDIGGFVKCSANKAYFVLPYENGPVKVSRYSLRYDGFIGGTTDIEEIEDAVNENNEFEIVETIFDLQGRKLNEITEPGIYIINGKKVFVK